MTATDSPPPGRIGVALTSVLTVRPSGTDSAISSARTVSPTPSCRASGNSLRETSRPSARRQELTSRSCSGGRPGIRRLSTMRLASRLNDTGRPLSPSKTATPTGDVATQDTATAADNEEIAGMLPGTGLAVADADAAEGESLTFHGVAGYRERLT